MYERSGTFRAHWATCARRPVWAVYDPDVRTGFVHEAVIQLAAGVDSAPGGAITVELCGHWEHEGDCRWPHHTAVVDRSGQTVRIRTVFVSRPEEEPAIRERIGSALAAGRVEGPTGVSRWTLSRSARAEPGPEERAMISRWVSS